MRKMVEDWVVGWTGHCLWRILRCVKWTFWEGNKANEGKAASKIRRRRRIVEESHSQSERSKESLFPSLFLFMFFVFDSFVVFFVFITFLKISIKIDIYIEIFVKLGHLYFHQYQHLKFWLHLIQTTLSFIHMKKISFF